MPYLSCTEQGGYAMRRRIVTIITAGLLSVGCSGGSSDAKSKASPSSAARGTEALSTQWGPKLKEATTAESAICNQVGDQACAEHLTDIALIVTDLEQAIAEAGGSGAYPQTTKQIADINKAVDAYTEHECLGDENAGIPGSPCPDDARTIMSGGAALHLALETDELKR